MFWTQVQASTDESFYTSRRSLFRVAPPAVHLLEIAVCFRKALELAARHKMCLGQDWPYLVLDSLCRLLVVFDVHHALFEGHHDLIDGVFSRMWGAVLGLVWHHWQALAFVNPPKIIPGQGARDALGEKLVNEEGGRLNNMLGLRHCRSREILHARSKCQKRCFHRGRPWPLRFCINITSDF